MMRSRNNMPVNNRGCISSIVGWGIAAVILAVVGGIVGYSTTVAHSALLGALVGVLGGEVCLAILFVLVQTIGWEGVQTLGEGCACCGELLSIFSSFIFVILGAGIGFLLWHNSWLGIMAGGSSMLAISIVFFVLFLAWQKATLTSARRVTVAQVR
jgi:hypothetical protein